MVKGVQKTLVGFAFLMAIGAIMWQIVSIHHGGAPWGSVTALWVSWAIIAMRVK